LRKLILQLEAGIIPVLGYMPVNTVEISRRVKYLISGELY